jgi:DNA-binding FadR family transcriptional regulator
VADLEHACPGVSRDFIREILKRLRDEGKVECLTRGGAGAPWRRLRDPDN